MVTSVPGATKPASCPPLRLAPAALAVSVGVPVVDAAATTTEYVTLLPGRPDALEVNSISLIATLDDAMTLGSGLPLFVPLIRFVIFRMMFAIVSLLATVYS